MGSILSFNKHTRTHTIASRKIFQNLTEIANYYPFIFTRIIQSESHVMTSAREVKGACSEIFGILIFLKLADMVTFPTNISSMVKKNANMQLICKPFEKKDNVYVTYCYINSGNHIF